MTGQRPAPTTVEGVDVDALESAVLACPAVDGLDRGPLGGVATYLPGRQIHGLRVDEDRVNVQIRMRWGATVEEVAQQVRAAVAIVAAGRPVDVVVTDIALPVTPAAPAPEVTGGAPA